MFEYFDAAGTSTNAGTFIPESDLINVAAAELADAEPDNLKFGKVVNGMTVALINAPNIDSVLGFAPSLGDIGGAGENDFIRDITFTWQKYKDHVAGTIEAIPLPSTGANLNKGGLSVDDVFPNAEKVAAAGAVSGAGIVVSSQAIADHVKFDHATYEVNDDSRLWFIGLAESLVTNAVIRGVDVSSPVVAASRPLLSSPAIPAEFTAVTDPISGIAEAARVYAGLDQRVLSMTLEYRVSPSGESFDVYSSTT